MTKVLENTWKGAALGLGLLWATGACSGDSGGAALLGPTGAQDLSGSSVEQMGGSTGSLIPDGSQEVTVTSIADQSLAVPVTALDDEQHEQPPTAEPVTILMNPFTVAEFDPYSTFAADVDTASYDIFRSSILNGGVLPSPASVRTEEFINAFQYDYPAPDADGAHPFSINLAATADYFDTPRTILRVGIQAQHPVAFDKKPANLAFLVDTSGSMQTALKLPLVQVLLSHTLEVLEPTDRVSIVTYGGSTGLALESTPVEESDAIRAVINDLSASGGTNGAEGLELAYSQVREHFIEEGINHVVLCTDGDFNVGPSTTEELVALIEEERRSGVTFTALGFGTTPNDEMMEAISNKGNGIYSVIGSEVQALQYAEERMLSNLQLIAKDLKIQVEFNPEQVYAYRLLGYENRALADDEFRDDQVDAGEVGAGHRVTAIYELALTEQQLPEGVQLSREESGLDAPLEVNGEELVLVKIRYKDVDAKETDEAYEVAERLALGELQEADPDLQWAGAMAAFAEVLRGSPLVEVSILDQVEAVVSRQSDRDDDRREFAELFAQARPRIEARFSR